MEMNTFRSMKILDALCNVAGIALSVIVTLIGVMAIRGIGLIGFGTDTAVIVTVVGILSLILFTAKSVIARLW